ncbi:FixH family protein [Pseudaminobacter soli (ex Li et al. 2025)]|uniref:Auxin-binding protein n=1 Tax=Pseudaminobacter soli (ex Li et al. 2025) TaxID=1295366 RepID=A0A2P7SN45_9HYPH|nr:FixH family protein [Mesorhizobium soli]PSJ63883.1 auxin-binding protein [Mesorhizobium soli]
MGFNWRYLVAIIGIAAVAAMALTKLYSVPPQPVSGPNFAFSKPSDQGTYVVAIEPETTPVKQGELHSWIVTVKTPDGKPVESAKITVSGGMPAHGHGLPTSPEVTDHLGEGRYRVEGVKFSMAGLWELKFAISAPQGDDQAVFNLML